nr:hypothetical protein [Tanacetum cinerariifolium]
MQTRSSSKLTRDQTSNPTSSTNTTPKGRNRRSSKQTVENSNLEEHLPLIVTMADNRTMAEMLRAPTEGCAEAIVVPPIVAEQFKLKYSLINMMTSDQFFGLEKDNPHDHIRVARRWLEKEPPHSITMWEDLVSKFINEFFPPQRTTSLRNEILNFEKKFGESFHEACDRYKDLLHACPHYGFTELHQLNTFYNALNPTDQDSLNAPAGGNLLERSTQDVLMIIENKSKVRNSQSKSIASQVKACDTNSDSEIAKLTHAVNEQTSVVTTAMTAMLKQLQATPPPAPVKAVEESCVTCGGAYPYYQCLVAGGNTFPEFRDNIQGYVLAAAVNYNQGNLGYRPQGVANQMRPPGFAQPNVQNNQIDLSHLKVSMKAMHTRIDMVKNELRNEMKTSIRTSLSNKTNEIKNMMVNLLQMNITSTSGLGSLPSNTVANPKGELKAITTRSGLVTDGPTVPTPPKSITPEVNERVEETYTDPDLTEYTIKVPSPPVQKYKPSFQREFVLHKRDPLHPNIPYPSWMLKQKQQEKDEVQIQNFWQMFKQLHINVTLVEALVLMPKYQKMLKALLSNKEKLQELANTPLNENCSAVLASLMPLSVWKELGLPELIPTRMTLELANRAICTPAGIARDVFVPVGKFIFPADFFIVDYESNPRVPLILGRPFLRTGRALIDVHGEEMILRDGDERLTLNMKHDTSSYSNHPQRELVNLINIFNVSRMQTSPEVTNDTYDSKGCNVLSEKLPDIDSTQDLHPYFYDNSLSGNTTYFSNSLLKEFTDELDLITYPLDYDDNLQFDIESDLKEIEFLLYQNKDSSLKDSIDQIDLPNLDDNFVDPIPEMFTDEHAPDYSSPLIFDVYDDDFLEVESDAENVYDDPFDSKGEKIKESKLLIDELDLPCDFLPPSEYDSFNSQDFSRVDALPQPATRTRSNDSLVLKDFDLPFYETLFFKDVPKSKMLLLFSSENEEKAFKPGIYTSEKPPKHLGCGFFVWKETRHRQLMSSPRALSAGPSTPPSYSLGPSTPPSYSSGPSTPPNYYPRSSRNAECSNCKHLRGKISVLKTTMDMHMHPKQHTVNSAALLHEVLNEMEKLDLE